MKDDRSANVPWPEPRAPSPLPGQGWRRVSRNGRLLRHQGTWLHAEGSPSQLRARQPSTGHFSCPDEGGQPVSHGDCASAAGDTCKGAGCTSGNIHQSPWVKTMGKAQLTWTSPPSSLTGAQTRGKKQLFNHKVCTA